MLLTPAASAPTMLLSCNPEAPGLSPEAFLAAFDADCAACPASWSAPSSGVGATTTTVPATSVDDIDRLIDRGLAAYAGRDFRGARDRFLDAAGLAQRLGSPRQEAIAFLELARTHELEGDNHGTFEAAFAASAAAASAGDSTIVSAAGALMGLPTTRTAHVSTSTPSSLVPLVGALRTAA